MVLTKMALYFFPLPDACDIASDEASRPNFRGLVLGFSGFENRGHRICKI